MNLFGKISHVFMIELRRTRNELEGSDIGVIIVDRQSLLCRYESPGLPEYFAQCLCTHSSTRHGINLSPNLCFPLNISQEKANNKSRTRRCTGKEKKIDPHGSKVIIKVRDRHPCLLIMALNGATPQNLPSL